MLRQRQRGLRLAVTRAFDLAVPVPALLLTLPLMAAIALGVLLAHGRPVLFSQVRPGLRGRLFRIRKFRTMNSQRGPDGQLLPDDQRLTRFGRILRATSLDELPQLFNVLLGQMSLVGPRPLLVEYLERYTPEQARRHDVLPGITGWSQINGRNAIGWDEKFLLDTWYVDNWSLGLDLRILAMTFFKVLRREGINKAGCGTTDVFRGSA
jgi:lipopolysaccharide/colanic/teichoic acid biosynthesis glycosyltransferase